MAKRAGSKETVAVAGASHVVMVSHPDAVAKIIEHAAAATCHTRDNRRTLKCQHHEQTDSSDAANARVLARYVRSSTAQHLRPG